MKVYWGPEPRYGSDGSAAAVSAAVSWLRGTNGNGCQ